MLRTTIILLAALATPVQAKSVLPTGPDAGDQQLSPLYRWAGPMPARPGLVLQTEPMPADKMPDAAGQALRLLYSSTDWRWQSGIVAASGALYLPKGAAPASGWPLIVWAHGTLGMADVCAPSWAGSNPRDRAYVNRWLEKGYAVVAPDYQGLGGPGPHPYTLWQAEGRSVLDAARAALKLDRLIANRVVITGQSQGSGATLGAARLARSYAPDLAVKGAIATALLTHIPGPDTPVETEMPGGSPYYLIYRMLGGGLPAGAPPLDSLLSDKGKILLQAARTACSPRDVAARENITLDNAFTRSPREINLLLGPAGKMDAFKVSFPLMIGTGLADELIPAARQVQTVGALCRMGNRIVWKGYDKTNHSNTLTISFDDAHAFAQGVLNGKPVASNCDALPG